MKNLWYIARRELAAYFTSPIAYVIIAVYLAVIGGLLGLSSITPARRRCVTFFCMACRCSFSSW